MQVNCMIFTADARARAGQVESTAKDAMTSHAAVVKFPPLWHISCLLFQGQVSLEFHLARPTSGMIHCFLSLHPLQYHIFAYHFKFCRSFFWNALFNHHPFPQTALDRFCFHRPFSSPTNLYPGICYYCYFHISGEVECRKSTQSRIIIFKRECGEGKSQHTKTQGLQNEK